MEDQFVETETSAQVTGGFFGLVASVLTFVISFFWLWLLVCMVLFVIDITLGKGLRLSGWWVSVMKWIFGKMNSFSSRKKVEIREGKPSPKVAIEPEVIPPQN